MKQAIKTIITVFVCIFCSFLCFLAVGLYVNMTEYLKYDVEYMSIPQLVEVKTDCLGDLYDYEGVTSKEGTFYRIAITFDNRTNYGRSDSSLYLGFESAAEDQYYSVMRQTDKGAGSYNGDYYIPAGREGTIYEVVLVENGCKKLRMKMTSHFSKEEKSYIIDL